MRAKQVCPDTKAETGRRLMHIQRAAASCLQSCKCGTRKTAAHPGGTDMPHYSQRTVPGHATLKPQHTVSRPSQLCPAICRPFWPQRFAGASTASAVTPAGAKNLPMPFPPSQASPTSARSLADWHVCTATQQLAPSPRTLVSGTSCTESVETAPCLAASPLR